MLEDALLLAGPALRQAGIRAMVEPPRRPLRVLADPEALRHALLNLLLNAAEHSAPGSDVHMRFTRGPWCTGLSIESRMRESALDGESSRGWGVGLRVVRSLLASQHGSLGSRIQSDGTVLIEIQWRRWPFQPVSPDFPETESVHALANPS
jgi:signal transduction histidine kinase